MSVKVWSVAETIAGKLVLEAAKSAVLDRVLITRVVGDRHRPISWALSGGL